MGRRIRVAFCTDGIYPHSMGGMQKHSRLLCAQLATHPDIELTVIHPHKGVRVFEDTSIHEIALDPIDPQRNYLMECYRYSKLVYNVLVELDPDIVYSQGLSIWYKARSLRHKLIINPHGLEPYQALGVKNKLAGIPFRMIFNSLFRKAAVVISLGGKLTTILKKVVPDPLKIVEIPNGVYLPAVQTSAPADKKLLTGLFLARFAHNKGIDVLFEAIDHFSRKPGGSPFHFVLGGKGPLYEFYKSKPPYPNATLLGFVKDEDIASLYQNADFFVFPTLFEGMPTVVLEAMSYGLPVIVSDVGATRELVDDTNGRIIDPGSSRDLIQALEWFGTLSLEERIRLSKNSLQRVETAFTWDKVAAQHHSLFSKLVNEKA